MITSIFNWSGGKDSALALFEVLQNTDKMNIESLITTVNRENGRISMHGVREELLDLQAKSIGLPLKKVLLPQMPTMEEYNAQMKAMLMEYVNAGVSRSIFGDIFLEDLRKYRDEKLMEVGMSGLYPLWKMDTKKIMKRFIKLGFKSVVVCVNSSVLDQSFLGRELNNSFIQDLPENVDVCGENGEYHTFVYDGPIFKAPISFNKGKTVFKDYSKDRPGKQSHDSGFWYLDLVI